MVKKPAYVFISWVFFILIGIVFGYSYFFYPDSHPIDCMIKDRTGKDCPGCGLSRAFSCYTHFEFEAGKEFNAFSWNIFVFLFFQLLLRLAIILHFQATRKPLKKAFINADITISICGFLLAFLPLIF